MMQEYLQGKKVLFVDDDCRMFYSDLFQMIADPELSLHFRAMQKRFAQLIQDERCIETVTVGLTDS